MKFEEAQAHIAKLSEEEKRRLDAMLAREISAKWLPSPQNIPQLSAYYSEADLLLYGGAAGSGKTSLLVGLAATSHRRSVIFRAKSIDLRGVEEYLLSVLSSDGWNGADKILRQPGIVIELGHLEKPGSENSWQGRPHDFIGFDEGAQLSKAKVRFVLGWLRSEDPRQRRRAVIASNPPTGGEGEWLIEWFAPWLDPRFKNPAVSGELRWAATAPDREGTTIWLPDGAPVVFTGERAWRRATPSENALSPEEARKRRLEIVKPMTRTFIPGRLEDNPYLRDTGYRAQLQALPEPLRSKMLHGDFLAGRQDHEWQVFPTAWVKAAQERWQPRPWHDGGMSAIAIDVAQGGADDNVVSARYGSWFDELIVVAGVLTPKPSDSAALVVTHRRDKAVVVVDVGGGYGGGVKERLEENEIAVRAFNGAGESSERTKDRQLYFANKRSEAHWRFREALDPDQEFGSQIALPPDPQLLADLASIRWKISSRGILLESKEELRKPERLGRSPDRGDAVVMCWSEGERGILAQTKKPHRLPTPAPTPQIRSSFGRASSTGWMAR